MKEVTIYTDGACSGNPGPGGYGTVLIYKDNVKKMSEGFSETTNNKMELLSVIVGLRTLKEKCKVNIYSDSKYVVSAINEGWLLKWQANGWRKADKKPVKNVELWEELLSLMDKHEIVFHWVKGHDGNEYNEICDRLAVEAYQKFLN